MFACHGIGGIVGALLTGVFATKAVNPNGADGLLAGNATLLGVQFMAVVSTIAFAAIASFVILRAMRLVMELRIPVDAELAGIDVTEHGEEAYHGSDLSDLTGRTLSLGDAVAIAASDFEHTTHRTVA